MDMDISLRAAHWSKEQRMARTPAPSWHGVRVPKTGGGPVRTLSYALRAVVFGRLPGEQTLSRWAVLTRLFAAFALALALWVYTTGQEDPVQTQLTGNVPVVPRGLRADVTLQNTLGTVTVKAVGLRSQLEKKVNIVASIDLKDVTKNTGEVVATVGLEGGNSNLQYTVTPPSVTLVFEPTVSQSVNVSFNPAVLLSLPATFTAPSPPQLSSLTVQVSGPKNLVNRVRSAVISASLAAVTTPSVSVASFPVSFSVTPMLVDKLGATIASTLLQVKPSTVKVTLQINQPQITKTLTILPIKGFGPPPGYILQSAQPDPASVVVSGPPNVLGPQETITTDPIDLRGVTGTTVITTHLNLPPGAAALSVNGRGTSGSDAGRPLWTVQVNVQRWVDTYALPLSIDIKHVGRGLSATLGGPVVVVRVYAAYVDIAKLLAHGLRASVDLSKLSPGVYNLRPAVHLPPNLSQHTITPQSVQVTIRGSKKR